MTQTTSCWIPRESLFGVSLELWCSGFDIWFGNTTKTHRCATGRWPKHSLKPVSHSRMHIPNAAKMSMEWVLRTLRPKISTSSKTYNLLLIADFIFIYSYNISYISLLFKSWIHELQEKLFIVSRIVRKNQEEIKKKLFIAYSKSWIAKFLLD